jgi:hypothetical protein
LDGMSSSLSTFSLFLDPGSYPLSILYRVQNNQRGLVIWWLTQRGMTIRTDLTPGEHILRCELLEATADPGGGHEFRIISVMRYVLPPFPPHFVTSSLLLFLLTLLSSRPLFPFDVMRCNRS